MGLLATVSGTSIYAFALMTNHAHILLRSGPQGLPTYMRRLLSGYAQYFNRRYKRVGHLFQNRCKSIICEEEAYFDKLVAYIHLNPLQAGLVDSLKKLAVYPWSGHAMIMDNVPYDWMDRDFVLQFFGSREETARKAYQGFLEKELGIKREKELTGGGLVRSQGGWSRIQSLRKRGERVLGDERILGGNDFVRSVLQNAEERRDVIMPEEEKLKRFDEAIEQACQAEGISVAFLRSGSRIGKLPVLRKQLAKRAVYELGLSIAETARHLGVTANAVSFMMKPQ
jgi:hypothetical protein